MLVTAMLLPTFCPVLGGGGSCAHARSFDAREGPSLWSSRQVCTILAIARRKTCLWFFLTATRTTWTTSATSTSTHTCDVTYANLARVAAHNPATTFTHPGFVFPAPVLEYVSAAPEHILPALVLAPMECAGETTQNTAEIPMVHERSTSQEIPAVRVAQWIQKRSVETIKASPQERISVLKWTHPGTCQCLKS